MDSVRSWVVGVARSVVYGYLYPKVVGLWGADCGHAHFRHEAEARLVLVGALGMAAWREWCVLAGVRWRPLTVCNPFQLYCNGVQWVTFKFNLKF